MVKRINAVEAYKIIFNFVFRYAFMDKINNKIEKHRIAILIICSSSSDPWEIFNIKFERKNIDLMKMLLSIIIIFSLL